MEWQGNGGAGGVLKSKAGFKVRMIKLEMVEMVKRR